MTVPGDKGQLALGPGSLRIASLGSTEPTDLVTPWDEAWIQFGYTAEGSKITYELETGEVMAAEEIDPIHQAINSRKTGLSFVLLQQTATNLSRAMNGGTITAGSGIVTFEPHQPGEEVRVMLGYQSEDETERWVFRECLQTGNVEQERKRGAENAKIPTDFKLAKPAYNILPFKAILASPLRA